MGNGILGTYLALPVHGFQARFPSRSGIYSSESDIRNARYDFFRLPFLPCSWTSHTSDSSFLFFRWLMNHNTRCPVLIRHVSHGILRVETRHPLLNHRHIGHRESLKLVEGIFRVKCQAQDSLNSLRSTNPCGRRTSIDIAKVATMRNIKHDIVDGPGIPSGGM